MRNIKNALKNNTTISAITLILIIVLQLFYTVNTFNKKEAFHSDEMWSYGLANSFYRPFLYLEPSASIFDANRLKALELWNSEYSANSGQWLSGSFFNNYLTVQDNQRFRYDSVFYNQSKDMHPPLYYSLLHTICSFFPNKFSWYFGLSLNLLFLVIAQIFLYLLAYELTKRKSVSLCVCMLYAFSAASLFTFTFIRQYSMLTMWTVVITYFAFKVYNSDFRKFLIPLIITSFAGMMTQYLILVYLFFITLSLCIYLLIKKQIKKMFVFGISMTTAVGIYFILWPYSFLSCIRNPDTQNHISTLYVEFKQYLNYLLYMVFGISNPFSIRTPMLSYLIPVMMVAVVIGGLAFVFRNDMWFKNICGVLKNYFSKTRIIINSNDIFVIMLFLSFMMTVLIIAKTTNIYLLGFAAIRYVSFLVPLIVLTLIYALKFILTTLSDNELLHICLIFVTAAVLCINSNISVNKNSVILYEQPGLTRDEIKQELSGNNAAVFTYSPSYMQLFPEYLMNTDKVYFNNYDAFFNDDYLKDEGIKNKGRLYILISSRTILRADEIDEYCSSNLINNILIKDADNETLRERGIVVIDEYLSHLESIDFVKEVKQITAMMNNDHQTNIYEVTFK